MPSAVLLMLIPLAMAALPSADPHQAAPNATTAESGEQLQNCRDGILDPDARPEGRRRWVQHLFTFTSPQAHDLIIELLGMAERPDVQRTLCAILIEGAQTHPDRLDPNYVDPLLKLLAAENDELRTSAAQVLAEFPNPEVAALLGSLAGDPSASMPARVAAIDALTPSTHRREVVAQLISLLDLEIPAVTEKVAAALDPITQDSFGTDTQQWRQWWDEQKRLSPEAWLSSQVHVYRERSRRVGAELNSLRTEREQESAALTAGMGELQRDILRAMQPEQREAKLIEWLDDPQTIVKLAALAIVKSRIADEGKRPEGQLLTAVLGQLNHPSPSIRREVLVIAQNLQNEQVVDAVLLQLKQEVDPPTRLAIFDTLGKLGSQTAVPALVQEIASEKAEPPCVRDAATAMGQIAVKVGRTDTVAAAAVPLKERYRQTKAEQAALRGALLTAMAGVGDLSFAPEFVEALGANDPLLLQPAIQGLTAIGDGTRLGRIRGFVVHEDPRVRLAAIEAIAKLGGEVADADVLLARLGPATEPNDLVRQASWRAWKELCARRSMAERLRAADQLRDYSDLREEFLKELVATLAASGNHRDELAEARARLSQLLISSGKYAESVSYLRDLYLSPPEMTRAGDIGLKWLEAVLRSPGQQGLAEVVGEISKTDDPDLRAQIVGTIRKYVDSPALAGDSDRTRRLLADLRTVDPKLVGDGWGELLKQLDASVKASQPTPSG